jgi:hypothetical protein
MNCPICDSEILFEQPSGWVPFIRDYLFDGRPPDNTRLYCVACEFVFCSHRFGPEEITRLYCAYRGPDYTERRTAHEPGYAALQRTFDDPAVLWARSKFSGKVIAEGHHKAFNSILDFGGGENGLFPEGITAQNKSVYDIRTGVQLDQGPHDLVLCQHVLEHAPYPLDMMKQLISLMAPKGRLYIEVPGHRGLKALHDKPLFSEHQSHFTVKALMRLIAKAGLRTLNYNYGAGVIGLLCDRASGEVK